MQNEIRLSAAFLEQWIGASNAPVQVRTVARLRGPVYAVVDPRELCIGEDLVVVPVQIHGESRLVPKLDFELKIGRFEIRDEILWAELERVGALRGPLLRVSQSVLVGSARLASAALARRDLPFRTNGTRIGWPLAPLVGALAPRLGPIEIESLRVDHGIELRFR